MNNKWWSILFGVVMLACFGLFIVAPLPGVGWWLPKTVSVFGGRVDALYYLILGITGFFFVLTEGLLIYFMYVYAGRPGAQEHPVGHHYAEKKVFWTSFFKSIFRPVSTLLHNQHRVELAWTLIPSVILLYIAFAQINVWAEIKNPESMPAQSKGNLDLGLEVSARMFEWRIRYPNPDGTPASDEAWGNWSVGPQVDDIHTVNEVHVWKGAKVKVFLKTKDVIHSFYLPNLRLKQDALPGKIIPVWFQVTESFNTVPVDAKGKRLASAASGAVRWVDGYDPDSKELDHTEQIWEIACAELCGWGHYKMQGKLYVHEDKKDFDAWLAAERIKGHAVQPNE